MHTSLRSVGFDEEKKALVILDQTALPNEVRVLHLSSAEEIWEAIHSLRVRGAPAIGVAAAIGLAVLSKNIEADDIESFQCEWKKLADYLATSRPTAVNLFWAIERMEKAMNAAKTVPEAREHLVAEAEAILEEDARVCKAIGENGLPLLKDGDGVLTHCNAGALATVAYGTALAPIYLAREAGLELRVYADETRPLLQGARLTTFELHSAGVDVTLICDNMAQSVMRKGWVDIVFVGCDRVAANGDVANKIGTSMVALSAARHGIPFYVCCPSSTIDFETRTGEDILIEERKPSEITDLWYAKPMAPKGVSVYNPAFDVTDHDLITGIITERGIAYPPYDESLRALFPDR